MIIVNVKDSQGNIIEEIIETNVRKQKVHLSGDLINTYLSLDIPDSPPHVFTDYELVDIFKPGKLGEPLPCTPAALTKEQRALFYIYSRSMVNKAKNFTHITGKDLQIMAGLITRQRWNVGDFIFQEIKRFRFHSSMHTTVPYPQLVSYILSMHNIWHLIPGGDIVRIPKFGKMHLIRMGITTPAGPTSKTRSHHSPPPEGSKKMDSQHKKVDPSPSKTGEGQSSRAVSPGPSFTQFALQTFIQDAIQHAILQLKKSNSELVDQVNYQMEVLVAQINYNYDLLCARQEEQTQRLQRIEDALRTHLHIPFPDPPSTSAPSTSALPDPPFVSPIIPSSVPSTSYISDHIPSRDLPQIDPILQTPSSSFHHTSSSSHTHTEEIIVEDSAEAVGLAPSIETTLVEPSSSSFSFQSPT